MLRAQLERDFHDTDVIDLRAHGVHAICWRSGENLLALCARNDANAHEQINDFVRPNTQEDMFWSWESAQRSKPFPDRVVRRGWVSVQI